MASRSPFEMLMAAFRTMKGQAPAAAPSPVLANAEQPEPKRRTDRRRLPWQVWHLVKRDAPPVGTFGHLRPGAAVPPPSGPFAHLRGDADAPPPTPSSPFAHLIPPPRRWPR